jgi:hypothetical protein
LRARATGVLQRYGFDLSAFRARSTKLKGLEVDAEVD